MKSGKYLQPTQSLLACVVLKIAVLALVVQIVSATFLVKNFGTPNASVPIAQNLVSTGEFWGGNPERLWGHYAHGERMRMFNLPGEPLLLGGAFRFLPLPMLRYVHIPFAVLLIVCATWMSGQVGGTSLAWMTGFVSTFNPFMVLHGPTWDDIFAASALTWAAICLIWSCLRQSRTDCEWFTAALLACLAAAAALFRSEAQIVLGVLGLTTLAIPKLRQTRLQGLALVVGIALAVGMWGARNKVVSGQFVAGSTHDGITLWESVYPSAGESILKRGGTEWLDLERMDSDYDKTARMNEVEANKYFIHRAVFYILSHPYAMLRLAGLKLVVDGVGIDFTRPLHSMRNVVSIAFNCGLILLALFSFARPWTISLREENKLFLLRTVAIIIVSVDVGLFVIGPVGLRYGATMYPLLWMAAAVTLVQTLSVMPGRRRESRAGVI